MQDGHTFVSFIWISLLRTDNFSFQNSTEMWNFWLFHFAISGVLTTCDERNDALGLLFKDFVKDSDLMIWKMTLFKKKNLRCLFVFCCVILLTQFAYEM